MAYKDKIRTSVPLTPELNERVEKLAQDMGMSKSSLCAQLIAQSIQNYEIAYTLMTDPSKLLEFQKMVNDISEDQISTVAKLKNEK